MNKKGFTLVEVLAVITLLSVITLMATVSINSIRNKINKNLFSAKLEYIINGAENYGQDNKSLVVENDQVLTVGSLLASNYLESDELKTYVSCEEGNFSSGKCRVITNNINKTVINSLEVKVYFDANRVYACIVKNANNKTLLEEDDSYSKYGSLNYYC